MRPRPLDHLLHSYPAILLLQPPTGLLIPWINQGLLQYGLADKNQGELLEATKAPQGLGEEAVQAGYPTIPH